MDLNSRVHILQEKTCPVLHLIVENPAPTGIHVIDPLGFGIVFPRKGQAFPIKIHDRPALFGSAGINQTVPHRQKSIECRCHTAALFSLRVKKVNRGLEPHVFRINSPFSARAGDQLIPGTYAEIGRSF